ncbi:unnamed protein product, partial [Polarella glacialis]
MDGRGAPEDRGLQLPPEMIRGLLHRAVASSSSPHGDAAGAGTQPARIDAGAERLVSLLAG